MSVIAKRCDWCEKDDLYRNYHDTEWGVPVFDDRKMFEFLILETFQAGLSWHTILRKRQNFKRAFDDFDFEKIANYPESKISQLLNDEGIIRNKLKITSAITNAQAFLKIRAEFGTFCNYFWAFTQHKTIVNPFETLKEIPTSTPLSDQISKDLKKRGFKFVGTTVIYAHIQAVGMVNDHLTSCFRHKELL